MWYKYKSDNENLNACSIRHDIFSECTFTYTGTNPLFSSASLLYTKPADMYINLLSCRWCFQWRLYHNGTSPHNALETIL